MNTTDFLSIASAICPDKLAIIFEDKRITFSQLSDRVNRLANALSDLGVGKGDRVAMLQVNSNQCVETYFASAKIGAIYVPLNYRAKSQELTYLLNSSGTKVLFVGERYLDLVNSIKPDLTSIEKIVTLEKKSDGMLDYEEMIASASTNEISANIDDNDTTMIVYTTGTTSLPKGVMLSHKSFSIYVLENVTPADPEVTEKNLLTAPLYHVAGIHAMMAAVYGGRTLVVERQFDPVEWMGLVQREKVTRAMMVPTMLKRVIDHPDFNKYDLSSLKVITYGAAPMPLEVIKKAMEVFPKVNFINAFGQTETASTITTLRPEDHVLTGTPRERAKKLKRLTSIGRPMPDVEMKIVDDDGNELPPGEIGEIIARGPRVMTGYWQDEEKTANTIDKEGWVHTGDRGYVDEDGYFYHVGRIIDTINRGGEKIAPEEVEAVLCCHAKVEEAVVFGVPDPDWGEVPVAAIVLRQGEECAPHELIEHCHQNLASFKRPKAVVFVREMPSNHMGKVSRRLLRELYRKGELH